MGSIIDQALDILRDTAPEYGNGFSNHAPMAAEALFQNAITFFHLTL